MSVPSVHTLVSFVRAIAILALDSRGQIQWLRSLGLPGEPALADELALEFDEGFLLLPSFVANGWLSDAAVLSLAPIEFALKAMSDPENPDIWSVEALDCDSRWEAVRRLARDALVQIG